MMNVLNYANDVANRIVWESRNDKPRLARIAGEWSIVIGEWESDLEPIGRAGFVHNHRCSNYRPSGEREQSVAPQSRLDSLQTFYAIAELSGTEVSPFDKAYEHK